MLSNEELIRQAASVINSRRLSACVQAGGVGSALITESGKTYVGVCVDADCGMGFCAEYNAIGNMITFGESKILKIVAVSKYGMVIPPCGRCREFIVQVNPENADTIVLLDKQKTVRLKELLPEHWLESILQN